MLISNILPSIHSLQTKFNLYKNEITKIAESSYFKNAFVFSAVLTALVYASQTDQVAGRSPSFSLNFLNQSSSQVLFNPSNSSYCLNNINSNQLFSIYKKNSKLLNLYNFFYDCLANNPLKKGLPINSIPLQKRATRLLLENWIVNNTLLNENLNTTVENKSLTPLKNHSTLILNNLTHKQNYVPVNISGTSFDACPLNDTGQKSNSTIKKSTSVAQKPNSLIIKSTSKFNILNGTCSKFKWPNLYSKPTCPAISSQTFNLESKGITKSDNHKLLLPALVAGGICALNTDKENKIYIWSGAVIWIIGNLAYERFKTFCIN